MHERDAREERVFGRHFLQILFDVREHLNDVENRDVFEVEQFVEVLGLEVEAGVLARQHRTRDDARSARRRKVHSGERRINRQIGRQRVVAGDEIKITVHKRDRAAECRMQLTEFLPRLTDTDFERPDLSAEIEVVDIGRCLHAESVDVEAIGAVGPIDADVEVDVGSHFKIDRCLRIEFQSVLFES